MGLGPSISSGIAKSLLYSGPSYPSSPVLIKPRQVKALPIGPETKHKAYFCVDKQDIYFIFYKAPGHDKIQHIHDTIEMQAPFPRSEIT